MIRVPRRFILATNSILKIEGLNAFYGDSHILYDVSFELKKDTVLALLGRNGAGKTTCISSIIGFLSGRSGLIELDGVELQNLSPEKICQAGIGIVPQGRRIFPSLTVKENLDVAYQAPRSGSSRQWNLEDVFQFFPRLNERKNQIAGSLSGGEQQMLAIGRALMTNPKVLLLDEPSEGLAPQIVKEVGNIIATLKPFISIVLVEQNLNLALSVADDVVLLNGGKVVFAGSKTLFTEKQQELQAHLSVE
ncbi:ABC transporter ATP-binding protein [Polynucleobacter sp. JS-Polo-80-F4]|nr:ABC transporter ATP-binding protein [Polynucleobacter sp. JS-Polo-80-F4]